MQTSLPETNGANADRHGLHQTVQQFFQQINWEDQPPEVEVLRQSAIARKDQPLSLSLTVSQFFNAIPWDGNIGANLPSPVIEPLSSAKAADSFTLDDFSGLF